MDLVVAEISYLQQVNILWLDIKTFYDSMISMILNVIIVATTGVISYLCSSSTFRSV